MKLTGDLLAGRLGAAVFFLVVLVPVGGARLAQSSRQHDEEKDTARFLKRCAEIRAERERHIHADIMEFENFMSQPDAMRIISAHEFDFRN